MSPSLHASGSDAFGSPRSVSAVSRLAYAFGQLLIDDGCVDTKSALGFNAAAVFMESIAEAAAELGLKPASRSYRANFTIKYRSLFPDESRDYQVDILEACLEQNAILLNGNKTELSAETRACAETLKWRWTNIIVILSCWNNTEPLQAQLRSRLVALDTAWAAFEKTYINELMLIEAKPIKLIMTAIRHEQKLDDLEAKHGHWTVVFMPEYMDTQNNLVQSIAHLNSLANFRRKGGSNLSVEILWNAMKTMQCRNEAEGKRDSSAAQSSCRDVVDSFLAIREYLRGVSTCLEQVNPHLGNNVGLVRRLVDWEESWEVSKHFVQNDIVFTAIHDLVAGIRLAQQIVPDLKRICKECDVELFMVLPSLLWLRGFENPAIHFHVFRSLLPHRFTSIQESVSDSQGPWPCDPELKAFIEQFHRTYALLVSSQHSMGRSSDRCGWKVLVKRVVLGSENQTREDTYGFLSPSIRSQAEQAVESLMSMMEGWSLEIQTHSAENWNELMSVIISVMDE